MTRRFDVVFVCNDCEEEVAREVVGYTIPKAATGDEVTKRLRMYTPEYCVDCGSDDFNVVSWVEIIEKDRP